MRYKILADESTWLSEDGQARITKDTDGDLMISCNFGKSWRPVKGAWLYGVKDERREELNIWDNLILDDED